MKKRLLFAFMAMCVAVSGFALTNGEFVYTPQGRFMITGDLAAYSNFTDFSGWQVVTAVDGKTVQNNFTIDTNGPEAGMNCAVSIDPTAGEGMYFTFVPTSATQDYVVSFKMKGAALGITRRFIAGDGNKPETDLVKVAGNTVGSYTYPSTDGEVIVNRGEELSEDWQTFNYAITGDGETRTYFISFTGISATTQIADLQIAPAQRYADLRQRDAMLEKLSSYKDCYNWPESVWQEQDGYIEAMDLLKAIGDESGQPELDEALTAAQDVLAQFLSDNMDDYLSGKSDNYLGIKTTSGNTQKATNYGDWTCVDRGYWNSGAYPDLGHYAGNTAWSYGHPDNPMGVTMQKTLDAGSYVFTIESLAATRDHATGSCWTLSESYKPAYGVAYVAKVVDGAVADTIVSVVKDLDAVDYTPFIAVAKVDESATYEIGFKAWCKEAYKTLKNGSVTYVKDATLYGKNDNKYNQNQLAYESAVRTQINKGREELTTAAENLANAEKYWGKAELQACVDTVAPKIAVYEALSQEAIMDTYQTDWVNSTKDEDKDVAYMIYEVYNEATRDIIAANRKFKAVNDTLASMQTAIDAAENTMAQRVYDAATGKEALKAAIATAQGIQAQMKAAEYSEENAAAIVAANEELAKAVETFKATIPATAIEEIISVDFESGAKQNAETLAYEVSGNNTVMTVENFSETTPIANEKGVGTMNFELGIDSNGEKVLPGVLRVGAGSAVATIPAKDYGTNIVKVSMDFWFIRLSDGLVGFELTDENDARVAGMQYVPYNNNLTGSGSAKGFDSFNIGDSNYGKFFKSNTAGDAASCADDNLSHIECILDYGEKSMYLVSTNASGSFTSEKVAFNGLVPVKITISSNYKNYIGRRCWFDNLKIEQIQAGPTDPFVGIENAKAADAKEAPVKVFENGQIIIGGKYNAAGAVVK